MLVNILKVIATLATAVTLFGCSGTRSTSAAATIVQSERETVILDERASTAVEEGRQTETQQTRATEYRPCIQGPETLRFLDRLTAEGHTLEGDEVQQFVDRLPPLTHQRFMAVLEEAGGQLEREQQKRRLEIKERFKRLGIEEPTPELIAMLDVLDSQGRDLAVTTNYGPSLITDIAEEYIGDCAEQLARLSAVTAIPDMWPAEAVARLWQSNLEFMKWWLANYRQKTRNTP